MFGQELPLCSYYYVAGRRGACLYVCRYVCQLVCACLDVCPVSLAPFNDYSEQREVRLAAILGMPNFQKH